MQNSSLSVRPPVDAKGLPIVGALPGLLVDPLRTMTRLAHQHSGAVLRIPFGPFQVYMLTHPRQISYVLHEKWRQYPKGENGMWQQIRRLFGDSLVTIDDARWIEDRRLLQPLFQRANLNAMVSEIVDSISDGLDSLSRLARSGAPLPISRAMARLSEDVLLRSLFGIKVTDSEAQELRESMMNAFAFAMTRMLFFFLPKYIPIPSELAYRRGIRRLDEAVYRLMQRRRTQPGPSKDLLTVLLNTRHPETGELLASKHVRDEIVTMFFAGHDSTSRTKTWALACLAQNPEALRKAQDEVDTVLGSRKPTLADVPNLKYLRQVVQETLRLYPAGWLMPRTAGEDDVIDGYTIPKGALLCINIYAVHRDPALWERADSFEPERFDGSESSWPRGQYIPFGGGPRLCIGDQFGLMNAQLTLAMFLQRFNPRLVPGKEFRARGMGGSLQPEADVMMYCTARS